jgi:hypothetical protein
MPDLASPTLSLRACSFFPLDLDSWTRGRNWSRYSLVRSGRATVADYSDGRLLPPTKERSEGGHPFAQSEVEVCGGGKKASKRRSQLE